MGEWDIVPLSPAHDVTGFSCGKASLDAFVRDSAGRYAKQNMGQTRVAVPKAGGRVLGYYTLACGSVPFERVPKKNGRGLPRHPQVPVLVLARLALDLSARGRKLGRELLMDALKVSAGVSDRAGAFAVVVVVIDDEAKRFYEHHEFRPLADETHYLYLPMKTVTKLFAPPA